MQDKKGTRENQNRAGRREGQKKNIGERNQDKGEKGRKTHQATGWHRENEPEPKEKQD